MPKIIPGCCTVAYQEGNHFTRRAAYLVGMEKADKLFDSLASKEGLASSSKEFYARLANNSDEGTQEDSLERILSKMHVVVMLELRPLRPLALEFTAGQSERAVDFLPDGSTIASAVTEELLNDQDREAINQFTARLTNRPLDDVTAESEAIDRSDSLLPLDLPRWVNSVAAGLVKSINSPVLLYVSRDYPDLIFLEYSLEEDIRRPKGYLNMIVRKMRHWAKL